MASALQQPDWFPQPPLPAKSTAFDDGPCEEWTGMVAAESEPPLTCGVLWFLHVPKTGGTTLMKHFHDNAGGGLPGKRGINGWRYANMWLNPVPIEARGAPGSPHQWATWNVSTKWTSIVLDELKQPQPKLIVHAHHNMPGLADPYMRDVVLRPMAKSMRSKGCEVRFATVLREPVAEIVSLMLFRHVPRERFVKSVRQNSEAMSKYLLYNFWTQWPAIYQQAPPTDEEGEELLHAAQDVLHNFSLVGRTEQLGVFVTNVNRMLGWPEDLTAPAANVAPWKDGKEAEFSSRWRPWDPNEDELHAVREANVFDSHLYHSFCATNGTAAERLATALVARTVPARANGLALLESVLGSR